MTDLRKHLWLDLEDTIITPVINGWFTTELMNITQIREVMKDFKPDQLNIFSFAIWNMHELELFNQGTRPMIEKALGMPLNFVPTVDDQIIPACCEIMGLHRGRVDFNDMRDFWSKHEAFRLMLRMLFRNNWKTWQIETEHILLDDMVINEIFEWPDIHVKGKILNIDSI